MVAVICVTLICYSCSLDLKELVGVWSIVYVDGYNDEYSISAEGKIALKGRVNRKPYIEASDNQIDFPTSGGWFKVSNIYEDGDWLYIHRKKNGTLDCRYFRLRSDGTWVYNNQHGTGSRKCKYYYYLFPIKASSI